MDFGPGAGIGSKGSMKRKQSSGLLGALRRDRTSSNAPPPPLPPSSYASPPHSYASPAEPESPYAESFSSHTASLQSSSLHGNRPPDSATSSSMRTPFERDLPSAASFSQSGGRMQSRIVSAAGSTMSSIGDSGKGKDRAGSSSLKRPEDVYRITRDRLFGWSFLMQWYQGDVHWFNTVKIPQSAVEQSLGQAQLESRARNFFVLGLSIARLFDTPGVLDFLRALSKLLDEWEQWAENSGKVKGLFRGKSKKTGSVSGDFIVTDTETSLVTANIPFVPDFFQVHSSTSSIIRDIYKKILRSILPPAPTNWTPPKHDPDINLHHPSTIIHSAPLDGEFPLSTQSPSTYMSPNASISGASSIQAGFPAINLDTFGPSPQMAEFGLSSGIPGPGTNINMPAGGSVQMDGFQALLAGELPSDRTLVGGGERLSPGIVDMFLKVDMKLKKQFSILLREGHELARHTLDQEISALLYSLTPGTGPIRFDLGAAMTQQGNGYIPDSLAVGRSASRSSGQSSSGHGHVPGSEGGRGYGHSYGMSVSSVGGASVHGYGGTSGWSREGSELREEEETEE